MNTSNSDQKRPPLDLPPRGPDPLSRRSRHKLLATLSAAAAAGDVVATAALVQLSQAGEVAQKIVHLIAESMPTQPGADQ